MPDNTSPTPLFDTLDNIDVEAYQRADIPKQYQLDCKHALQFLYSYRGSQATFNSYRRELERFLQWCWLIAKKSITEITSSDIEKFVEFCQQPPNNWIGVKNVPRFINKEGTRIANPDWHPYVVNVSKSAFKTGKTAEIKNYSLSEKALTAVFAILGSFYSYLLQISYVTSNPVAQIRQKSKFIRKYQAKTPIRRLTELQWSYIIETVELMAQKQPQLHERTLFIMSILFSMYLRISELAASKRWLPKMGDFERDLDGNWWFITVGKGNKQRNITVSDSMLDTLKRYRLSLSLSPLPTPGDTTPLIAKTRGKGPITSTRQIRTIVQNCFNAAILRLKHDGFTEEALQLEAATVHWLRHTGISEDVKHRPREHVRDDAGHSSSAITDKYIDVEMRARHASAKKKKIKPED